jgi:hypothetical protein
MFDVADLGRAKQKLGVYSLKGWAVAGLLSEDEVDAFNTCGKMDLRLLQFRDRCKHVHAFPCQSLHHFRTDIPRRACEQKGGHVFILHSP